MFDFQMEPISIQLFLIFFGLEVVWQFLERRYPYKWDPSLKEDTAQEQHAQERLAYVYPRISSNERPTNSTLQSAKRIDSETSSHYGSSSSEGNNDTSQVTQRNNIGASSHDESSVDKRNKKAKCGSLKNTDSGDVTPVPPSLLIKPLVLIPETRHPSRFKMPTIPLQKPFASKKKGSSPEFSSWEVAFEGNVRRSRLLQLPDELLLEIMHATAIDDLYMLRQVSFTFWRLYQGCEFDRFYRTHMQPLTVPSQRNLPLPAGFRHDKKTVTRARRNAFCEPCLEVLESGTHKAKLGKELFCSFCPTVS